MRIWSLHPCLLDRRALVACWRETLLAQKVLRGLTRGYSFNRALIGAGENSTGKNSSGKNDTDKNCADKSENPYASVARIPVPLGQLEYELAFLRHKVAGRDPEWEHRLSERLTARGELAACAHPLFEVVPGAIEPWEKTKDF